MPIYSFGPFQLDSEARRLLRGSEAVAVPDRHLEILLQLVEHPGAVLSKDALIESAWGDVAVTDNSLEQAISALRRAIAEEGAPAAIETVPRRGYRFVAVVSRAVRRESDATLAALLAPHGAWLEGRSLLESLDTTRLQQAEAAFREALASLPDLAPPHIGLANAFVFRYEATRLDAAPDVEALTTALTHAREACRLEPALAETWATLGFVLSRAGNKDALAAARRAVVLEPDNWRHQLRLAFVGWGEERLRASARALRLLPGLGLAHFLAATIYVARQSYDVAEREVENGIASQDASSTHDARFGGVGLHWLRGLLRLRAGETESASVDFERELAIDAAGHLYGAECAANVLYAQAAMAWQAGSIEFAVSALDAARSKAAGHPLVWAARSALSPSPEHAAGLTAVLSRLRSHGLVVDAAIAESVADAVHGNDAQVSGRVHDALAAAADGPQGWALPLDPFLRVTRNEAAWSGALARLRSRAA